MTVREGTDVNNLRVGDVIGRVWDEDTREDSCHCSIVCTITLDVVGPLAVGVRTVEVVSHNLLDGDIVRGKVEREEEGDCHCDYVFTVERV
jgi:hypothetical protein